MALTRAELEEILAAVGSVAELVNTRHASVKERGWKEEAPSKADFVAAVLEEPNVMRRPRGHRREARGRREGRRRLAASAGLSERGNAKPVARKRPSRAVKAPVLLTGGNPRIAKADGAEPVQAYIAAMPGWKRDIGRRLDALVVRGAPGVQRAVKWSSPLYGNKQPEVRYFDIREDDALDEKLLASWIRQAAALPGWAP